MPTYPGILRLNSMWRWLLLILILASLAWRFYDIDRDPPRVSGSKAEFLDAGAYLYHARSYAMFGDWRLQGNLPEYLAPGYSVLSAWWFKIAGAGYSQAVFLSVFSSFIAMACVVLCAGIAARRWSTVPAVWAGGFALLCMSLSYVLGGMQRVPKGDMESAAVIGLCTLALFVLESPGLTNRIAAWLSAFVGFGIGIVPLIKLHSGIFSISVILAWCLGLSWGDALWQKIARRNTPALFGGLCIAGIVWLIFMAWLSQANTLGGFIKPFAEIPPWFFKAPSGEASLIPWRFVRSNLTYRQPIETFLVTFAVSAYLSDLRRHWTRFFCVVWLLVGVALFSVLSYDPLRYRLLFVIPAMILTGHFWGSLAAGIAPWPKTSSERVSFSSACLFLGFGVISSLELFFKPPASNLRFIGLAVLTAFAMAAVWYGMRRLHSHTVAALLVLGVIVFALPQWIDAETHGTHKYRDIAANLPADARVLSGEVGLVVSLWTKLDCEKDVTADVTHVITQVPEQVAMNKSVRFVEIGRTDVPGLGEPVVTLKVIR